MGSFKFGPITISIDDSIQVPEESGKMDKKRQNEVLRSFREVGMTCSAVAAAMRNYPDRLQVPGVTAETLESGGAQAEDVDVVQSNLKTAAVFFMQASLLLHENAHNLLRRVNRFVQSQEAWDATLPGLVPELAEYFAKNPPTASEKEPA